MKQRKWHYNISKCYVYVWEYDWCDSIKMMMLYCVKQMMIVMKKYCIIGLIVEKWLLLLKQRRLLIDKRSNDDTIIEWYDIDDRAIIEAVVIEVLSLLLQYW